MSLSNRLAIYHVSWWVLILVLVEDALWGAFNKYRGNTLPEVLILVLVEDALWVYPDDSKDAGKKIVLILVLVEDALWVVCIGYTIKR